MCPFKVGKTGCFVYGKYRQSSSGIKVQVAVTNTAEVLVTLSQDKEAGRSTEPYLSYMGHCPLYFMYIFKKAVLSRRVAIISSVGWI